MLKILKNLKQSWLSVIVIVILLVVQAACDLTLPDYTSKIVNVGIQNGGIEDVSPEMIRKSTMDNMLIFTENDETILSSYKEISKDSLEEKEYEKLVEEYPALENETLYKINKLSKDEKDNLNAVIAKPLMIVGYLSDEELTTKMKEQMTANMPEQQKAMMQNMELIDIIKQMPEEQLNTMLEEINKKIDDMQDSILEQATIQQVKEEYKSIGVNTDNLQNKYIIISGLKMLGISLIIMVSAILIMLLSARVGAKLGKTLREKVFKKVLSFSNKEFSEYSTASLITRSTNDIQQIQGLMGMLFRTVVYAPIIGVGGFLRVLRQSDNSMAWIIGVAIVAILFVVATLFIIAMPKFKKLQKLIDKLNLVAREILTGLPVIRAFNTEKREEKRFDAANIDLTKTNLFVNRAMSFMMPLLMLIMNSISLLIVWVGSHGVDNGTMQVGNMMAFIQYTMQIVMSFLFISMLSIILPRASVSANRINEVLETDEFIKESKNPKQLNSDKKGLVEFKNVGFKYPDSDEEVLSDITFTAKPGETTAIIGSTGSGKSTIVNLIPRFYDITSGNLLIDGVDIKDIASKDLRKIIGFVPQKGILFSGTIESNIKYGNSEMPDEQMIEAAQIAQAEEFIESKPLKYQEPIAQGGSNVSGGQKQRLSIARAIAVDPEIFVFDDSFSALDFKTDSILRQELSKKTKDKTVIIVAQRINTILNADQIIVLEDGKVVGKGKHEELIKNNEIYRQIALSQLSEEELNLEGGNKHE
ncbi:MAG: ABC transporter ATP-binding protein [Clostridia bacterium]|nr:ABC transporter ATP-binding protein [Clostridia bacterium]